MRKNFFKTMKRSKYVLGVSAVTLMGAMAMSANGNCMAMLTSDGSKAEEVNSAPIVKKHRDVPKAKCDGTAANEDNSDVPDGDIQKSEEHADVSKVEKRESPKMKISKAEALEDIESVFNLIKDRHVSAIERIPGEVRDQFELEIANLGDEVTYIDEWRIISRILSKLHDAHTRTWTPNFLNKRKLPLETEYRDGKFVCTDGKNVGYEIEAINGILVRDLYKIFQEHYSYELEEWTEYKFFEDPSDFIPEWKLALCGIDTTKPIELNLKKDEDRKVVRVDLFEMPEPEKEPWISYKFDTENGIGYYRLDECNVSDELANFLTYLEQGKRGKIKEIFEKDEYAKSIHEFFLSVKDKGIKNVIVDLRKNYGGNSLVADLFIFYLARLKDYKTECILERKGDKIETHDREIEILNASQVAFRKNLPLFNGKVYILTSHYTFSAAKDFAVLLSDNDLATIVGEVPGNSVTQFGDMTGWVFTPNLRIEFCTTFKRFERPDPTKDKYRLIPDVQVPAKDALAKVYELVEAEKRAAE